jgi:hypothetical protein
MKYKDDPITYAQYPYNQAGTRFSHDIASWELRDAGSFFILLNDPLRGRPFFGAEPIIVHEIERGNDPASQLKKTIFIRQAPIHN